MPACQHGPIRAALLVSLVLLSATLAGCLSTEDPGGDDAASPPPDEQGALPQPPERLELVDCDEQFGVFTVPASQAEPYLPEGFELVGVGGGPLPEGLAVLFVESLACQGPSEGETSNHLWPHLLVDPPPAYDREDAVFQYITIRLGGTSPTFVDALHAWGIPQAMPAEIGIEAEATAPGLESWRTTASAENGSAVMVTEAVGHHPEGDGVVARMFGVEDGELVGIVDVEATAWEGGFGTATFDNAGLVPLDVDEAGSGGVALDYDVVLTPVDLPTGT